MGRLNEYKDDVVGLVELIPRSSLLDAILLLMTLEKYFLLKERKKKRRKEKTRLKDLLKILN